MTMLAEVVDAVVGVDTHRDTHEVEIASPTPSPSPCARSATTAPATPSCWPGSSTTPRGLGWLSRSRAAAATASGCPRDDPQAWRFSSPSNPPARPATGRATPTPSTRTWPCSPHCAWTPTGCPIPRVDGDREALRILLGARHDLTVACTAQTNRLRALLLGSDHDADRDLARGVALRRRVDRAGPSPTPATTPIVSRSCGTARSVVCGGRARRRPALKDNRAQLQTIVATWRPG